MENYMSIPANSSLDYVDKIEQMYPDAYTRVYPHVQYLVNSIGDENLHKFTNDDVDHITQEAMRRSNVINDPPPGHTMHTVGDMTRALVVRDLHDRHRHGRFFPFFSPFFFFPFDGRDHDRFRDFDRDRDMERRHDRF